MSLRVWLPLDGDLRNLGCSEVTATASGATVNTSGKIGSCYSFDGSNDFISLSGNTLYNIFKGGSQQFSICFWVYHNDATRAIIFGDYGLSGAIGFNIELTTSHGVRFYWNGSPDKNFNSTSYVAAQGWTHIVITYNGSILNIYRNGILSTDSWSGTLATKNKTAGQFYLGRDSRTGATVLNGRLNDFRIYDHCLSAAEVHEIAQGLVLHYKLDQPANINNNLYTGSQNFTGTWVNSSLWTTSTETYQNFTVKQRSATWGGLAQNVPCAQGDIFTISFWGKVDSGGNIQSVHRSNLGNVTTGLTILNGNFSSGTIWVNNSEDGTQWKRYWGTVQITGSDVTYLQWRLENSVSGKNFYICGIKLEKGAAPSAWSFAASEVGETNIIYDSSGYNHNGTIIGDPYIVANSARYENAMYFTGRPCAIKSVSTFSHLNTFTYSCWFKRNTNEEAFILMGYQYGNNSSGSLAIVGNKPGFHYYVHANGQGDTQVGITQTCNDNNWHHLAATYDGTTIITYYDGIQTAEKNITLLTTIRTFSLNYTNTGSSNRDYQGQLSDARVYCTALDANAIRQLYELGMKIDNNHNLHAFEVVENNNKISLNNKRQFKCNEVVENELTKFFNNELVEAHQIIEC